MDIRKAVENYRNTLIKRIAKLNEELKDVPEGHLSCSRKGKYKSFVIRTAKNSKRTSRGIRPGDESFDSYANKYYAEKQLKNLEMNLRAADSFLAFHTGVEERDIIDSIDEDILAHSHVYMNDPVLNPEKWMQEKPFAENTIAIETPNYSIRGDALRSKSEVIIADSLFKVNIAYKNEFAIKLWDPFTKREVVRFPDFTIRHPRTGKIILWEHLGIMDEEDYATKACNKLQLYAENGFNVGDNLIITMESSGAPLSSRYVNHLIRKFFLD